MGFRYKRGMATARDHAADLLLRFERDGTRIRELLGDPRDRLADPRERSLLTELAYGSVRRRGTLDAVLMSASKRPVKRLNAAVRAALRVALYQLLFLDRIPDHAAVDHAVTWARGKAGAKRAGYANAVLRALVRDRVDDAAGDADLRRDVPREDGTFIRFGRVVFADPDREPARNLAGRYSAPEWLVRRWLERWGSRRTETVLRAGITRPPVTLRARVERPVLGAILKARETAFQEGPVATSLLLHGSEGAALASVKSGEAAVQDATSQRVAPLLEPVAGERILDLCAAPGGKTLHIADLLKTGALVACDVDEAKLDDLRALGQEMESIEYEVLLVPPKGKLPFEKRSFDAVLVDAPCTNTGVLRRRVEARWRLRVADIPALAKLQVDLVRRALTLVKPGGRLVYSTCSLEEEENEDVLGAVLAKHPTLEGNTAFRAWPGRELDGGYAAVIRVSE